MQSRRLDLRAALMAAGILCIAIAAGSNAHADDRPAALRIFAAASLSDVLKTLTDQYQRKSGQGAVIAVAATSTVARQLAAGAEADVFISADTRWMEWLSDRKLVDPDSVRTVAPNTLVVVGPAGDTRPTGTDSREIDTTAAATWTALAKRGRIAMGDPAHVPAGSYAKAALESLGHWKIVAPRLVAADNVRNALALVERGEVPAGIVYATDARISKRVVVIGRFPPGSHTPIAYPAARVASSTAPGADAFLTFLGSPAAKAIFKSYGFTAR